MLKCRTEELMAFQRKKRKKQKQQPQQQQNHTPDFQKLVVEHPQVAYVTATNDWVESRNETQKRYLQTVRDNHITIGIGPAGTGKTFLPVAMGLHALLNTEEVSKIIITRPVVEAGERLGFLPGDLEEKINPYLRPIYDAMNQMIGPAELQRLLGDNRIELAPLAYMRGRTLEDAFIILDEAQNTTMDQIEMLLTRLGNGSKIVVTGDVTQIDLPKKKNSGLVRLEEAIGHLNGIKFFKFTDADVIRHPLVKELVKAYEQWKTKQESK